MEMLKTMALGLICLSISGATLAGEYTDQVRAKLAVIKLAALAGEWRETHNDKFGNLENGNSDFFSFQLSKGTSYKVVSVCDEDCSDLDLTLYDENYNEISKDSGTDSMPIVDSSPKWTGKFWLKVTMYSCSNNPCYYGISILGK